MASIECAFLSLINNPPGDTSSRYAGRALQDIVATLTYMAILLNVGAAWGSIRMIDILGKMPIMNAVRQAQSDGNPPGGEFNFSSKSPVNDAMKAYGLRGRWEVLAWHCK